MLEDMGGLEDLLLSESIYMPGGQKLRRIARRCGKLLWEVRGKYEQNLIGSKMHQTVTVIISLSYCTCVGLGLGWLGLDWVGWVWIIDNYAGVRSRIHVSSLLRFFAGILLFLFEPEPHQRGNFPSPEVGWPAKFLISRYPQIPNPQVPKSAKPQTTQ